MQDPNALFNSMEALRLLFENRIIHGMTPLDVRPIDLYTGQPADEADAAISNTYQNRKLYGLPTQGIFTANTAPKSNMMYHTFTGTDISCVASVGNVVSELRGLTTLSWSIHRGKQTQRTMGKSSPAGRGRGSRTVAGTMVFALSDHHPLSEIVPDDYPVKQNTMWSWDPNQWKPMILADMIPPFDLVVVLWNEYGNASVLPIYQIDIVDEGSVIGVDNLITELSVSYVAGAIDPISQAEPDANGNIDPFNLTFSSFSDMWMRREIVTEGIAYSDLEKLYENQFAYLVTKNIGLKP